MKKKLWAVALLSLSFQAEAAKILVTQFDFQFNGGTDIYSQMAANLAADGHSVDVVDVRTPNTLSATLGATTYDQVFLLDLTSTPYLSATDITALSNFWNDNSGLVVDTRAYGYHFQGSNASEIQLLQNVASTFVLTGGGVWVGTDHDPMWTTNANPFLSAIGIDTVTGSFGNPVNFADPSSVLLSGVNPVDLWAAGQTVGQAPIGLQPNGLEMFVHFGHTRTDGSVLPYISASFPLQGPDPSTNVPEPGSVALIGLGLLGLIAARRRREPSQH